MAIRRKFVVVDTRGLVPEDPSGEPPCAIDRVRIQHDRDLQGGPNRPLANWSGMCTTGDVFKLDGLVYVCAVMWAEDNKAGGKP